MRSTIRRITVVTSLAVLLAPGLLHARTPIQRHDVQRARASASRSIPEMGSFSSVWNLLSIWMMKTGPGLDPSGGAKPNTAPSPSGNETGTQLDPSGVPRP